MQVYYSTTQKGDGAENEDCLGFLGNTFWVIDGATDVFDHHYFSESDDTAWYVRELNKSILNHIDSGLGLREILINAVKQIKCAVEREHPHIKKVNGWELPSFAIAMGRIKDSCFEYYVLGDCGIYLFTGKEDQIITDTRISSISQINRDNLANALEDNINDQGEKQIYQKTRMLMNQEDGYWIGSLDGKGLEHAIEGKIKVDRAYMRCLCYSDGFSEALDVFKISGYSHALFEGDNVEQIIKELRKKQEEDIHREIHLRVRKKDDLTVMLIKE